MSLIKVKITVRSSVKNDAEPTSEQANEEHLGYMRYSEGEGVVRLSYKSVCDGACTETVIEPHGGALLLKRRGAIDSDMLFEVGKTHASLYKIPPYSFDMTLTARRVDCSLSPFGGSVELEYFMTVGGCEKECVMHIRAVPV